MSSAAKRRKDAASAKKAKTEARKGHITEISKKRSAMEQAKVSDASDLYTFDFVFYRHQIMLDGSAILTIVGGFDEAFQLPPRTN